MQNTKECSSVCIGWGEGVSGILWDSP